MMEYEVYEGMITDLDDKDVFVFGSNPEGRHGLGAAKTAANKFGAKYGIGRGLQGKSYGLVTKNLKAGFFEKLTGIKYEKQGKRSVSEKQIRDNINELYELARKMPDHKFFIAYMANQPNLNGYTDKEMADMFYDKNIPNNIVFETNFFDLVFAQ